MSFNLEEFVKKYAPHRETIDFIKARADDNVKPIYEVGVERARQNGIEAAAKYGGSVELDGKTFDINIPSEFDKGTSFLLICNF